MAPTDPLVFFAARFDPVVFTDPVSFDPPPTTPPARFDGPPVAFDTPPAAPDASALPLPELVRQVAALPAGHPRRAALQKAIDARAALLRLTPLGQEVLRNYGLK